MKIPALKARLCTLALVTGATISLASRAAVQETELASFTKADGCGDATLIQGSDGNFYGTKEACGGLFAKSGTVFQLTASGKLTKLHTFVASDGENPKAGLVEGPDGAFYGTTSFGFGGQFNLGTVYRITSSGAFTTLHHFTDSGDGAEPEVGLVVGQDGALYGVSNGSTPQIFRITTEGTLTTLHTFSGEAANTLVEGADGNLYGTIIHGGTYGKGSIFQLTPAGDFITLYSFTAGADGAYPVSLHQGSNGDLFGSTSLTPASLFTLTPGGALKTVTTFPSGLGVIMQASDGNYYGTLPPITTVGDIFFSLTPDGVMTPLFTFSTNNYSKHSGNHTSALIQGTDGSFYGTTVSGGIWGPLFGGTGGASHFGNAFRITLTP